MTYEQTREQFLLAWNSNAYLNMCESDDMHNAIVALEKQIPRKCRIKGTAKLQTFYCPTCEQVVVSRIENEWLAGRLQKYCDSCGQALDWSDNNG